jgi:hypothetical protein
MAERTKRQEIWGYIERALKNAAVAVAGEIACIDTADGALVPVSAAATLVPIGYFLSSATGDGTAIMRVKLFNDVHLERFLNDTGTAVTAAQNQQLCYLKDGRTVSGDSTSRSVAGKVWHVSTSPAYVLVEIGATADLVDNT